MTDRRRFDRPPHEVFAALTEPERLAVWHHAFDHAERLDDGQLAVGSRIRVTSRVDGRPADLDLEVVAIEPGRSVTIEGRSDDVRSRAELAVAADGAGSEVTATTRAVVDDQDDDRTVEPEANAAFADLGGALLRGLEAALTDVPTEPS